MHTAALPPTRPLRELAAELWAWGKHALGRALSWRANHAKLLQHAQVIGVAPMFRKPPMSHTDDIRDHDSELFARRRDAKNSPL